MTDHCLRVSVTLVEDLVSVPTCSSQPPIMIVGRYSILPSSDFLRHKVMYLDTCRQTKYSYIF